MVNLDISLFNTFIILILLYLYKRLMTTNIRIQQNLFVLIKYLNTCFQYILLIKNFEI